MRLCFATPVVAALALISIESTAQGLPPAPAAPAANPSAPAAAPTPQPAAVAAPPEPGATVPPGTGTPPPPPTTTAPPATGSTTIPKGGQPDPVGLTPRPAPKMKKVWYGLETLIGAGAGNVLMLVGGYTPREFLRYVGVAGHVFSGPIVHWTHGHIGKGFAALGLNVGAPLLGALTASVLVYNDASSVELAVFIGGGLGYIMGPSLDIALLSTEQVPDSTTTVPKGARLLWPSSVSVMPMLDQNRRGLMLVGQF